MKNPSKIFIQQSQRQLLFELLKYANQRENELIITTHSPYIINYLTSAIKAYSTKLSIPNDSVDLIERLTAIVPLASCLNGDNVVIYELTNDGKIIKLPTYNNLPSDDNFLNASLAESNNMFDDLLEIKQACLR